MVIDNPILELDRQWALADWAVRVALPVYGLGTAYGQPSDVVNNLPRLLLDNAGEDGLDALRGLSEIREPVVGDIPGACFSIAEMSLSTTGFGRNARGLLVETGLPYLLWRRSRQLCRLYALEAYTLLNGNPAVWAAWLEGGAKTAQLIGEVHPVMQGWLWQG